MTSKEALENIKNAVEYLTRLDYVEPIVRGEVKELLYKAYHKTTPEFDIIEKDLEVLEILKNHLEIKGYNDDFLYPVIKLCISSVGTEKDFNKIKEWLEK